MVRPCRGHCALHHASPLYPTLLAQVRNLLGPRRLPWALVLAVSFPDGTPWARLELPEDEYVAVMAIQAADKQHAVTALRRLRELHAVHAPPPHRPGRDASTG